MTGPPIRPIAPSEIRIVGAAPLARTVHLDPRGFLVETLRRDDAAVGGERFALAYSSLTVPGQYRDADRWHAHRIQTDRFVVPLGTMTLALLDARRESATYGRLEVIEMAGRPFSAPPVERPATETLALVPIPPGVYHCIGNRSSAPFLLQNFPTELYDPGDEGRVPFTEAAGLTGGVPFAWDRVGRTER